ncbi:MAG: acyl-CoA dehydrogenase, partial [bacterium]|nr:acyl-CoA dehydrogenase [bacterium]
MGFEATERAQEICARVDVFMDEHIFPREHEYEEFTTDQDNLWKTPPFVRELRAKAREQGLWNLFLPEEYKPWSPGLTNVEVAHVFERMSRVTWAQTIFNCNAPDRGNMEVL